MNELNAIAESMMKVADMMRPINELVDGYRADAAKRGYSPTIAEAMAMELHSQMIRLAFAGAGGAS